MTHKVPFQVFGPLLMSHKEDISELFCLYCVAALKVSPHFQLILLLFQSSGIACTITFHSRVVSWVRCGT